MITVVDQVSPWLTPSRTLAMTIHAQPGAPAEQERDGHGDQPAGDQYRLAAHPFGDRAGDNVGDRLHHSEGDDVRERGAVGVQMEHTRGDQRQNGALLAEHAANQRVDPDEEGELARLAWSPRSLERAAIIVR